MTFDRFYGEKMFNSINFAAAGESTGGMFSFILDNFAEMSAGDVVKMIAMWITGGLILGFFG